MPVQARKGGRQAEISFQFTVLFEKNIESFSECQPLGIVYFSSCSAPFRGWTGAGNRDVGTSEPDAVQTGIEKLYCRFSVDSGGSTSRIVSVLGNVSMETVSNGSYPVAVSGEFGQPGDSIFTTHQRTAGETRPVNIVLPIILYIGVFV